MNPEIIRIANPDEAIISDDSGLDTINIIKDTKIKVIKTITPEALIFELLLLLLVFNFSSPFI